MKSSLFVLFFIGLTYLSMCPIVRGQHFAITTHGVPTALTLWEGNVVLAADSQLTLVHGNRLLRSITMPDVVTALSRVRSTLWIGTRRGLYRLDHGATTAQPVSIPALDEHPEITTVLATPDDSVWVGTERFGVFRGRDSSWQGVLSVTPVTCGGVSPDGAVWIGTHVGLFRYDRSGWVRYAEEGVQNFEIAGNIIDGVFPDRAGNVWALTDDQVSFLARPVPGGGEGGEPITLDYLGRPGNRITDIVPLRTGGYLIASSIGMLFLPHVEEVPKVTEGEEFHHAGVRGSALLLTPAQTGLSQTMQSMPVRKLAVDSKGNVWFSSQGLMWSCTERTLLRSIGALRRANAHERPHAQVGR